MRRTAGACSALRQSGAAPLPPMSLAAAWAAAALKQGMRRGKRRAGRSAQASRGVEVVGRAGARTLDRQPTELAAGLTHPRAAACACRCPRLHSREAGTRQRGPAPRRRSAAAVPPAGRCTPRPRGSRPPTCVSGGGQGRGRAQAFRRRDAAAARQSGRTLHTQSMADSCQPSLSTTRTQRSLDGGRRGVPAAQPL